MTDVSQTDRQTSDAAGRLLLRVGAIVGIVLFVLACRNGDRASTCISDFLNFYSGARLAFSNQIYSAQAEKRVQRETLGCAGENYDQFVRLPYFAALIWPIAQLPFHTALAVWRALCVAAVLAFVWLWPGPRWRTLAVCTWSFPLLAAFAFGQDIPLLLLLVGAALALLDRDHDFAAGLCLSLGAAKPHIFVLWVLLILARRRWRAVQGLAAGGVALVGLSFLAGGAGWPGEFLRTVTGPAGSPNAQRMINLHGMAYFLHAPFWLEALLAVAFFVLLGQACLRLPTLFAFPLSLGAGVLLGGHSYLYDLALCTPLVLVLLASATVPVWLRWVSVGFTSPLVYLLPSVIPPADFVHLLLPLFLAIVALALTPPSSWWPGKSRRDAESSFTCSQW